AAFDGAGGGNQGLPDHLTAEDALPPRLRAAPAEEIVLERLEIEDGEKLFDRARHFVGYSNQKTKEVWVARVVAQPQTRSPPLAGGPTNRWRAAAAIFGEG